MVYFYRKEYFQDNNEGGTMVVVSSGIMEWEAMSITEFFFLLVRGDLIPKNIFAVRKKVGKMEKGFSLPTR